MYMNIARPLDGLDLLDKKRVSLDLKNRTTITGILKDFDYNLHVLLVYVEYITEEGTKKYGVMLIRGNTIICVHQVKV